MKSRHSSELFLSLFGTLSVLLILTCFSPQPLLALDLHLAVTQYVHDTWQTEDGLPQNGVYDLLLDKRGYIWAATEEGPARFDGVRFKVCSGKSLVAEGQPSPDTSAAPRDLSGTMIMSMLESREGGIWLGTFSGELFRVREGRIVEFIGADEIPGHWILCLCQDRQGQLWFGTSDGLVRLKKNGKQPEYTTEARAGRQLDQSHRRGSPGSALDRDAERSEPAGKWRAWYNYHRRVRIPDGDPGPLRRPARVALDRH